MIVRTIEAIKKDLETSTTKVIALEKEMEEIKEQMDAELQAWENVLRTILPDTPTLEQAQVAHEEAERVRDRVRETQQRLAAFVKNLHSLRETLVSQDDRLRALQQELNRDRLVYSTVYLYILLATDDHA